MGTVVLPFRRSTDLRASSNVACVAGGKIARSAREGDTRWGKYRLPESSLGSRRIKNIGSARYALERETRVGETTNGNFPFFRERKKPFWGAFRAGGTFIIACLPPSRSSLFFPHWLRSSQGNKWPC